MCVRGPMGMKSGWSGGVSWVDWSLPNVTLKVLLQPVVREEVRISQETKKREQTINGSLTHTHTPL